MSFLRNIAGVLSDFTQRAIGTSNPFQVSEISHAAIRTWESVFTEESFTLYKDKNSYKGVLCSSLLPQKIFVIFKLPNLDEAKSTFNALSYKLQMLISCSSILLSLGELQKISDVIRQYPTYGCSHIAAYIGCSACLSKGNILLSLNDVDEETGKTALHVAIEQGNVDCIQELLFLNAMHSSVDKFGQTIFHYAARCKNDNIIKILASKDASSINQLNVAGETALHEACMNGLHENVEMLLRWKADPCLTGSNRYPIHCAVSSNSIGCVKTLYRWNSETVHLKEKSTGNHALHIALSKEMIHCLVELGCCTEVRNSCTQTPLLTKVEQSDLSCALALLIVGAHIAARDEGGNGALHFAGKLNSPDLLQMLIVFGADVNLCNDQQISPRHAVAFSGGRNRDLMLHYLHMVGAARCDDLKRNCNDCCKFDGTFNGSPKVSTTTNDTVSTVVDEFLEASALSAAVSRSESAFNFEVDDVHLAKPGYRILCLDGGGIRGLVSIKILMAIESVTGKPIEKIFDWIGGTSTGGILTVGLLQRKGLSYMLGAYFRLKDEVFQGKRPYNSDPLESFIKKEFGEWTRMTDIREPRVMLMSVLADRMPAQLHIFKNYEIPGIQHDPLPSPFKRFHPIPRPQDQLVWEAVRATGAAPTYFRAVGRFIDGGLVSNNPTLDVLAEIHKFNSANRATGNSRAMMPLHVVVSLGTGKHPKRFIENCDVFRPEGIFDFTKAFCGAKNLGEHLINQATQSEGQSVTRAAAWCNMIDVPYFRLNPQLSEFIPLDCTDDAMLINMLWETQCYLQRNHDKLVQLGNLLLC